MKTFECRIKGTQAWRSTPGLDIYDAAETFVREGDEDEEELTDEKIIEVRHDARAEPTTRFPLPVYEIKVTCQVERTYSSQDADYEEQDQDT